MEDLIGKTLANRYVVDTFLGRGGMAEVYRVWDQQRASFLAMKLLHADLAEDKIFVRRFKREAEALERLQHPSIVRFYGLEQDAEDRTFILMDFVDGITLRKKISASKQLFSNAQILEIARPVCSALHYAHHQGLIHCDVKPANIMLEHQGRVLLADFGIARMSEATTTTAVMSGGTPAYMAPEQVQGADPLPQTDLYSLGIVLYELVTGGERPFTGEHARTTGSTSDKVRWEQVNLAPPAPRTLNPKLSAAVEAVVLRCLEKDPHRRFGSAMELIDALAAAIEGKKAPPPAKPAAASISAKAADQLQLTMVPPAQVQAPVPVHTPAPVPVQAPPAVVHPAPEPVRAAPPRAAAGARPYAPPPPAAAPPPLPVMLANDRPLRAQRRARRWVWAAVVLAAVLVVAGVAGLAFGGGGGGATATPERPSATLPAAAPVLTASATRTASATPYTPSPTLATPTRTASPSPTGTPTATATVTRTATPTFFIPWTLPPPPTNTPEPQQPPPPPAKTPAPP